MKPALPLRIASILALIAALGHTLLFLTYKPTHGPDEIVVVAAMQTSASAASSTATGSSTLAEKIFSSNSAQKSHVKPQNHLN
jgi:hypothetical protein